MLLRQLNEDSQEEVNKDESLDQHSTANETAKTANPRYNEVENEEDEKRDGQLRLLRMRHQSKAFRAQTHELLQSVKNNPK